MEKESTLNDGRRHEGCGQKNTLTLEALLGVLLGVRNIELCEHGVVNIHILSLEVLDLNNGIRKRLEPPPSLEMITERTHFARAFSKANGA